MTRRNLAALVFLAGLSLSPAAALGAQTCSASPTLLCLSGRRFSVEARWKDFQGNTGAGHAVALSADTGYFWFFSDTNVELVVKVLDGRGLNGHFWVFYGALSNVEYEMTVRDLATGDTRIYRNPAGRFASAGDTTAFPPEPGAAALGQSRRLLSSYGLPLDESRIAPAPEEKAAACTPAATALCIGGGRFRVAATWKDFQGNTGAGQAVSLTGDTGYFWFFSSSNVEVVVKALDGRGLNDHFWIFYGALSNVEYTMTVTDTVTGVVRTYRNPSGLFASVGDTAAFGKPTTFELIEGAVVKGEIDEETALLYKVYGFFGDPRLPSIYLGEPPPREHGILMEVADRWSSLSTRTQQTLGPFLTPPIYPGSWFGPGTTPARKSPAAIGADWTRLETVHSAVWYREADSGAAAAAQNLAAEIEKIWTTETGLMQREPLSDSAKTNNGGDGKLDIYVLPRLQGRPTDQAVTIGYPPGGQPMAAYILVKISSASTVERARDVLAHEFFHTIAASYNFKDGFDAYRWMNEATAEWMEDYVYPTQIHNLEQLLAPDYFVSGYKSSFEKADDGGYQDYVFFFYLARLIASAPAADVNHRIWNNVESLSSLQAIDAAIPGGFKERWPEFALYCWNRPDVDSFQKWDSFSEKLTDTSADPYLRLESGNGEGDGLPARSVDHLAMSYAYIDVASESIKRLEIQNQAVGTNTGKAKTQAWIKLADGSTRIEDWTEKPRVVFCRDKASEHVTELLILYTNSERDKNSPAIVWGEGKVIADEVGCGGFRGTVRETRRGVGQGGVTANESMDVTARFLPEPNLPDHYYLAQISMRYAFTAFNPLVQCTLTVDPVTQSKSFAEGDDEASGNDIVIDKSVSPAGYSAAGSWGFIASARSECAGQPGGTTQSGVGGEWWKVPAGFFRVNKDGSLSGDYTETLDGATATWTWNFTPD